MNLVVCLSVYTVSELFINLFLYLSNLALGQDARIAHFSSTYLSYLLFCLSNYSSVYQFGFCSRREVHIFLNLFIHLLIHLFLYLSIWLSSKARELYISSLSTHLFVNLFTIDLLTHLFLILISSTFYSFTSLSIYQCIYELIYSFHPWFCFSPFLFVHRAENVLWFLY